MGWALEVVMIEEVGSRVWAHWSEERVFGIVESNRAAHGLGPDRSILTGRYTSQMAEMIRQRIAHPEWTWNPAYDPKHHPETAEEIAARARVATVRLSR